jgi:hypothetical protein
MKYLKLFESFNEHQAMEVVIDWMLKLYDIKNYTINEDGTIDVRGDVDLSNKGLTELPLKFRNVMGNFWCDSNKLISLEGCPQSVGGSFNCQINQLKTLEGGPQLVDGSFYCDSNQLISLEGAPQSVGGFFSCSYNQLTSLKGGPQSVGYNSIFKVNNNKLTSLEGGPKSIRVDFNVNPCYRIYIDWVNTDRRDELMDMMKDYDFLRGDVINWYLLEAFFNDAGLKVPDRKELEKHYTIED